MGADLEAHSHRAALHALANGIALNLYRHFNNSSPHHALNEGGGRDDRDAAEGVQRQQVPIPADDELGMAVDREFEEFVIRRVAAGDDTLADRHRLGGGQHPDYAFAQIRDHYPGDVGPAQSLFESCHPSFCHPGAGRDPPLGKFPLLITFHRSGEPSVDRAAELWIPAFAGMT
jgi:hypothetical protein